MKEIPVLFDNYYARAFKQLIAAPECIIYLLTHFPSIDIDITMFRQYRIDIVSKAKKWYRSITNPEPTFTRESRVFFHVDQTLRRRIAALCRLSAKRRRTSFSTGCRALVDALSALSLSVSAAATRCARSSYRHAAETISARAKLWRPASALRIRRFGTGVANTRGLESKLIVIRTFL